MRVLIFLSIWLVIDLYSFQAVKTLIYRANFSNPSLYLWSFWIIDITLVLILFFYGFTGRFAGGPNRHVNWILALSMLSMLPKLVMIPALLLEDIFRTFYFLYAKTAQVISSSSNTVHFTGRRKVISQLALGLASIPFLGLIHGVIKGKYKYQVRRVKLTFENLPEVFNGFTITQLSDIHAGSFDDREQVKRGVALANAQKSDLLVFTGDLVNNLASEMDEWIDVFDKLQAPMGKFSILGNHDYGDYVQWSSAEAKADNLRKVKAVHKQIGFKLLLNEHVKLEKDGEIIQLIGVENWGKKGFVKHGDLDTATHGISKDSFSILLSHDPSHWEAKVLDHHIPIPLTLSGHTHGMQFGIEIPGFRWSPSQYIYPQWAGAYKQENNYLYVNRGFGFLGLPGRVGIFPEITVIELVRG
jgi:predicted MPP superfamily phosphohydrolase